jgi:rod shape-determining protein MreC
MFSWKLLRVVGIVFLIAVNIIFLAASSKAGYALRGPGGIAVSLVAPFQEIVTHSTRFAKEIWRHYFALVSVAKENERLRKALSLAIEKNNHCNELQLSNLRLRKLLSFQKNVSEEALAAEVIGKDPSAWFKTIIVDKGRSDGVKMGLPVVVPEGIVGQIVDVTNHYSKVLLVIDANSAVDAMVQRSRSRGVIKGDSTGRLSFEYVLRKHDIQVGDSVVSSGLDGVFPKGLRLGEVAEVAKGNAGIFQRVAVLPFVDFEKIEELFIILNPPAVEAEADPPLEDSTQMKVQERTKPSANPKTHLNGRAG